MSENPDSGGVVADAAGTERRVFFQGDDRLEGMLGRPVAGAEGAVRAPGEVDGGVRAGVVVAHPYPPHGATMDLPVVYGIAKSCRQRGFATLRFNFRSVGGSRGGFSGTEEHRDVAAAVGYLGEELAGPGGGRSLGLAGYSFGSVMAARAVAELPSVKALALVGFAVRWEHLPADTLERLARYHGPVLAVCAENDHVGSPDEVERALTGIGLDLRLEVVRGADHFLQGRHREVGEWVADFFETVLTGERIGRPSTG